jgi:hypothetical protein
MDLSPKMFRDIPKVISYHYKEGNFNWPMIIYITFVHTTALIGVLKLAQCTPQTLLWAFLLWPTRYVSQHLCQSKCRNL